MSYYDVRQAGHKEPWTYETIHGDNPADRKASQDDALGRALETASSMARDRQREWVVSFVDDSAKPPVMRELARYGAEEEREAE